MNSLQDPECLDVQVGDRIRLIAMGTEADGRKDPDPIESGTRGTVLGVTHWYADSSTLTMRWDNGRYLGLVCPPDSFEVIQRMRSRFFEGDWW